RVRSTTEKRSRGKLIAFSPSQEGWPSWRARPDCAWASGGVDRGEEVEKGPVEGFGVLQVDGVAGLRHHDEPGRGNLALHEEGGLQARLVLVARDDERRHLELFHLLVEVENRRPRHLHPLQR